MYVYIDLHEDSIRKVYLNRCNLASFRSRVIESWYVQCERGDGIHFSDHETRHSSSVRIEDDDRAGERTPLITARQVTNSIVESRNPITTIVVTTLLLILIIGVLISVYLLIEDRKCTNTFLFIWYIFISGFCNNV